MSIYRRGTVWWYHIVVKGNEVRGSCHTRDEKSALELHDRMRADMWSEKHLGTTARHTVDEAIDKFLKAHESKKSHRDDIRHGRWWKAQFKSFGVKMIDEVTSKVLTEIRDEYAESKTRRGTKMTPATVNRKTAFISAVVMSAAHEWQWISSPPKCKRMPGERSRHRFLEPSEVMRLVECLPKPYADMALFAVSTGLRQANVLGLRWDQVNLQRRMATFPEEVMKNGRPFSCHLNDTAISVIKNWVGQHDEYVFINGLGKKSSGVPSKLWAKALEKADLKDVRWHDLRHTWASLLRQAGVNLPDLQEMGGWENASMVQRYAHVNKEHLAANAGLMDGFLSERKTSHLSLVAG
jgi:integrase